MKHHIEDIKNIREELNWRVKITYTSTAVFYTVIIFILGVFVKEDYKLNVQDQNLFIPLSSTIALLISMYVATLSANHLIEKKIELYILQIQKKILKKISRKKKENPRFSWISFLYADEYEHYLKSNKFMQKVHNFALCIYPAFQFGLPNAIPIIILGVIAYHGFYKAHIVVIIYYIFVCVMCLSSLFLGIVFVIFLTKVKKVHRKFFYDHIHSYLTNNKREKK